MTDESQRSLLILVTSDPAKSPRPAEAVRIAAGVSAWKKCRVSVYLHQPTAQALVYSAAEVMDEAQFRQCLPLLGGESGPRVHVPPGFGKRLAEIWSTDAFQETTPDELGALTASSTWLIHF